MFCETGYTSTRKYGNLDSFIDATIQGRAPNDGLFVSNAPVPHLKLGQWDRLVHSSYSDCALHILEKWLSPVDLKHKVFNYQEIA